MIHYSRQWFSISLLAALALAGCAVQFVSRYDEATEKSITSIQRQVGSMLQEIERADGKPEQAYENYADRYKQLHVDAGILSVRAQAIDQNEITVEQSELLIGWLNNLETLHKSGIGGADLVAVTRPQAEQIFVAMLKFELAKKRQLDPAVITKE